MSIFVEAAQEEEEAQVDFVGGLYLSFESDESADLFLSRRSSRRDRNRFAFPTLSLRARARAPISPRKITFNERGHATHYAVLKNATCVAGGGARLV